VINMGNAVPTNPRMSVADRMAARSSQGGRPLSREEQDVRDEDLAAPARSSTAAPGVVPIRLGSVADVVVARGPSEVRRIRSQRAAVVSANLSGRDLTSVSEEIRRELQHLRQEIPEHTTIGLAGQNEELEASYKSLLLALVLAVFLVYLVMASQFESLIHPFIIMFTVPLGLIGVVLALFFTRTTFNVMVFLGVIILAGIVVNNAIVLIDYANQLRQQGLSKREALVKAGDVRLRPILMTTLTTVLGLIPMALGWGEGAEVRAPMAITVMGGLTFCTLLTLVFIPVLYEVMDRKMYSADFAPQPSTVVYGSPSMGEQQPGALVFEDGSEPRP
jgi:HAE1 family hydrophobic/amphiphilic exporter-1